jgi:hypothetical protein
VISADSRWQRSSHGAELVRSWHTSVTDMVAPFLATETCHDTLHDSSSGALRPADTPDCRGGRRVAPELEGLGLIPTALRFEGQPSRSQESVDEHGLALYALEPLLNALEPIPDHDGRLIDASPGPDLDPGRQLDDDQAVPPMQTQRRRFNADARVAGGTPSLRGPILKAMQAPLSPSVAQANHGQERCLGRTRGHTLQGAGGHGAVPLASWEPGRASYCVRGEQFREHDGPSHRVK